MKKLLLLTTVMVFSASLVFAQGGVIQVTADPSGTNCNLSDQVPGLVTWWVVQLYSPGATASQFSAPQPACAPFLLWLSDTPQFPVTIGSSQVGVAIGYGACLGSPIALLGINYFAQIPSPPCCDYPVLPDPAVPSGQIEVVDCTDNLITATGGVSTINPDPTCECDVPTQETTWGGVKALYAE